MIEVHPVIKLLGGLVVIVFGTEMLLRSATTIATMLRISPIVIGLTIVAAVCLPVFRSDGKVSRLEGAIFVAAYLAYLAALVTLGI